jgi:hypothetical protein
MIDLFQSLSECGDLVAYWDVAGRHDGVLLRARSRLQYSSQHAAEEAARMISDKLHPNGYDVREVSAGAATAGNGDSAWHAFVEILVSTERVG